ncbi:MULTISPECIES: hypothetical protein [unclassified Acinetobacter]|uniref:hypothetical protein n=1 Tax=unclassified Acinetobacter TaxID=196816 RepID=UPI00051ACF07|nr:MULTISPECIES: hypothetical protein [unclassified Acinetobacter]
MATDVDVQYFSHLNGLTLGNNWGDMIRLLDTCLVNGLPFTSVTSASIDAQGDITLNLYAAHNALLFQIVELTGFSPSEINGKYRIKGTPTPTQLVLKAEHAGKTISTVGTAKLAALGYEIIFRDLGDVKRVYRAKNPRSEHPFIRVDETISDGTNSYTSTYAKYAMVGLLAHMDHIDDFNNPDVLQLPLDTNDPAKNWKITGTGTGVVRGWSRWYWARSTPPDNSNTSNDTTVSNGSRKFSLIGDSSTFYLLTELVVGNTGKILNGIGCINSDIELITKNWFLMCTLSEKSASQLQGDQYGYWANAVGYQPLMRNSTTGCFYTTADLIGLNNHAYAYPIQHDFNSGSSNVFSGTATPAIEIPFYDSNKKLRGQLPHILYAGKVLNAQSDTQYFLSEKSMYVSDIAMSTGSIGGFYFYLGELE